jgi:aminomethyltransferase
LAVAGRRPPRQGYPVVVDGEVAGEVTSGNFSPVLGHGIALALLPAGVDDSAKVEIDSRGHLEEAAIVGVPFIPKRR